MTALRLVALAGVAFGLVGAADAADVKVKGVHLCCGACVKDADAALKAVDGLTGIAIDRDSKLVAFKAPDEKVAKAGIDALAKEGFHGTATLDDKELPFPESGAKKGDTADIVTLTGLHLCCGACVTGAKEALKDIPGVTGMDIDRNDKSVKLTGKNIDITGAVAALNKGGFHGTVKKK